MRCFLSVFVERFGEFSNCRSNLLTLTNLKDLDKCTMLYRNAKELRENFDEEIKKFKKDYETQLELWKYKHPGKTNNGKIYANFITSSIIKNREKIFIATVPIMYANDKLVSFNEAIDHIAYYLDIDSNFEKLFNEKIYLLNDEKHLKREEENGFIDETEYNLAYDYINHGRDAVLRREVINRLIDRIRKMDDDDKYVTLRCLMNLCHLNKREIYTKKGVISNINDRIPQNTILHSSNYKYGYSSQLIQSENDDELYQLKKQIKKRGK